MTFPINFDENNINHMDKISIKTRKQSRIYRNLELKNTINSNLNLNRNTSLEEMNIIRLNALKNYYISNC